MSVQRYSGNVGKLAMLGTSWSFANDAQGLELTVVEKDIENLAPSPLS